MSNFEEKIRLTKYEIVNLIGTRATELSGGAKPTVSTKGLTDPIKIAIKEYEAGTIPLVVKRRFPNGDVQLIHILEAK